MKARDALTKTLAILGTALVTLPLLAPFILGMAVIGRPGGFRLDYLMPFEIYPVTLVGMALLVAASFRARWHRLTIVATIGAMLGGLLLAGFAAEVTGIADSVTRLETWRYALTIGLGAVSLLAQVGFAVEGVLLTRDLYRESSVNDAPLTPAAS